MNDAKTIEVGNRHISPWTTQQKIGRVLWWFIQATLWRWSWHSWYGYRRLVLRVFGAQVSRTARVRPSVRIECPWNLSIGENAVVGDRANLYALGKIMIGDRATISQQSHLCAGSHDVNDPEMPLLRPPIVIEPDAWIAADAFVGPGVIIGHGAVLGARGCAFKSIDAWTINGGNPAKCIGDRQRFDQPSPTSTDIEAS